MKTPDITPAQIGALVLAIGGQAVSWGILSGHTEQLVVAVATAAVSIGWKIADAIIRNGRAHSGAANTLDTVVSLLLAASPSSSAKPPGP